MNLGTKRFWVLESVVLVVISRRRRRKKKKKKKSLILAFVHRSRSEKRKQKNDNKVTLVRSAGQEDVGRKSVFRSVLQFVARGDSLSTRCIRPAQRFRQRKREICAHFLAVLCLVVANIYLCMGVWTEDMRETGAVCQNTPPLAIQRAVRLE